MGKIVVLDGHSLNPGDLSWEELEKLGKLTVYDNTAPSEVGSRICDADYVFTNQVYISALALDKSPNLKFIGTLATGFNSINVDETAKRNIVVCNVPSYGTDACAQFTFALLLEICHRVQRHSDAVFSGKWTKCPDFCFWDYPLIELSGKTLAIIGYGRIGKKVAQIGKAMGMKVLAYSPTLISGNSDENADYVDFFTLLKNSDVISLHCPWNKKTEGIINKDSIAKMKDGVIIINTARGRLIVEQDLKDALDAKKVYGAGLDVVVGEPIKTDNVLLTCENVIITPHIAWAPKEARQRLLMTATNNLASFQKGIIINKVN